MPDDPPTATILVVDDEPAIRDFLTVVLEGEGFGVQTAADGCEVLNVLAEHGPPDVVLTDLMMPCMDGYTLIAQLRRTQLPVRAIVAMSGMATVGARDPQADLFLAKPFDLDQVLDGLQALLAEAGTG